MHDSSIQGGSVLSPGLVSSFFPAGTVPLPYLGAVITISLNLMLLVDCLLLNGYTITPAKPQQRLTCSAPAAAPTAASAANLVQKAEPAFNR